MKRVFVAFAVLSIGLSASSRAFAAIEAGDDIQINTWPHAGQSQGPFKVTIYNDDDKTVGHVANPLGDLERNPFLTFCVEVREFFYNGQVFDIKGFSDVSVSTGRTLTGYSAWVYEQFITLGLTPSSSPAPINGVAFGDAMNAYQYAIWSGMVDLNGGVIDASYLGSIANSEYGAEFPGGTAYELHTNTTLDVLGIDYDTFLAPSNSDWGANEAARLLNTGDVDAINIDGDGAWGQDQLIVITISHHDDVPEPASLIVWTVLGAGAAGLALRRRRAAALAGPQKTGKRSSE
jgi:hypothetical protein